MAGYIKGTDVRHEITVIREAVAKIGAAMQSDQDAAQAFADATELERLGSEISREASAFRKWLPAMLVDQRGMSQAEVARSLNLTPGRVGQLVRAGRKQEMNPIVDPGSLPLQPPLILAVVHGTQGVLVCHRIDNRPPWSFPGGDMRHDEPPADAALRRVTAETGLSVKPMAVLGQRVHPRTGRYTIYLACQPEDDSAVPIVGDTEDLDAVEWVGLDLVRSRMPDMFEPVLAHLQAVLSTQETF